MGATAEKALFLDAIPLMFLRISITDRAPSEERGPKKTGPRPYTVGL